MKKPKKKGGLKPHSKAKVAKLEKHGAKSAVVGKGGLDKALKILEKAPAAVDVVRSTAVVEVAPAKEKVPAGLVEVTIEGTSLTLLGMRNQQATPTLEQRVAIAKRLNEVGPNLPRYVKKVVKSTTSIGDAEMGKTKSNPAGLDVKEIQKAFDQSNKEVAEREAQARKDAAKKAKEDEAKRAAESKARKKLKAADVTPKSTVPPKPEKVKPGQDPKAQVKGVSTPPAKPKAGMQMGAVPKGGFTAANKPGTSGELIRARIGEHKMTDDAIASEVRKLWPGRTTAVSDVRWNRSQMQKAGIKGVPEPVEGSTVPGKKK